MGNGSLSSSLNALRSFVSERQEVHLGKLAQVPRYLHIPSLLRCPSERSCYFAIHQTVENLGRAMQLGQHRRLIDSLNLALGRETLAAMTSIAIRDSEISAAFAVSLTTLEQAYHWPRDVSVSTPDVLEDHKLVIQMLNQPQLREMLQSFLEVEKSADVLLSPDHIAQTALNMARSILEEVSLTHERGLPIPRDTQDTVNLLYRTCRSDWGDQGDYHDVHSHREFGRLHEVARASGTQRRMQELFEKSDGLLCLQAMPNLLKGLPCLTNMLSDALTQLQFAIAVAREELFSVAVDEVIWGRAFANFSKAVGFCDISAGGGDAPIFWMLDSLCGQTHPKNQATLPEELNFRSRFFPPNMRKLMSRMQGLPALREYCQSVEVPYELNQSFKALERQRFELYEMHRKKAARICVSLRAGQKGTSAGVSGCPYATPEHRLAETLDTAMTARFGDDHDQIFIDAVAQAHSLMFDEEGTVYSARVRFNFSTPLAIGPGDCLLVSVQLPTGFWETRTYSITYTYDSHQPLEHDAHRIASVAEVYVRSKGPVSSYLCGQTQACKARIAVKPASQFRIVGNSNTQETTVLVAQGGALGIFVGWLEAQSRLEGRYILIVAARHFSQLGFKKELLRLSDALKGCLRIVVVLSKPQASDIPLLESAGIETYRGRVTEYFDSFSSSHTRVTYICGTSSFGLNVARASSLSRSIRKAPRRLEPVITSRLPLIRLHVAPETPIQRQLPVISPAEVAQHNAPNDLWISVNDNIYDITALSSFHPGGEKILMARAGRRADDLFNSVHGGSVDVQSLLQNMIIGRLAPSNLEHSIWLGWLDKVVEIQNDLTNHSRFEKLPDGSTQDLAETPPTQVIYASVECFVRDWCPLLEEIGVSGSKQCQLARAWIGLKGKLDSSQAAVYNESFEDSHSCQQGVLQVYDKLRNISGDIHLALDAVKSRIAVCISNELLLDAGILAACTDIVIKAINS